MIVKVPELTSLPNIIPICLALFQTFSNPVREPKGQNISLGTIYLLPTWNLHKAFLITNPSHSPTESQIADTLVTSRRQNLRCIWALLNGIHSTKTNFRMDIHAAALPLLANTLESLTQVPHTILLFTEITNLYDWNKYFRYILIINDMD